MVTGFGRSAGVVRVVGVHRLVHLAGGSGRLVLPGRGNRPVGLRLTELPVILRLLELPVGLELTDLPVGLKLVGLLVGPGLAELPVGLGLLELPLVPRVGERLAGPVRWSVLAAGDAVHEGRHQAGVVLGLVVHG